MYENLIHKPSTASSPKPLSIRLSDIPYDKRIRYVESVCAVLIESRFGPGRPKPIVIDLRESPERASAVFYELTPAGPVPSYTILPTSEMARRYAEDVIRHELALADLRAIAIRNQPLSPSTHGRGSP